MKKTSSSPPTAFSGATENPLAQRFQILINSLTVIGFAMLAAAGQVPSFLGLLFLILFVPLFHPLFRTRFQLEPRLGNLLTWIYVPVFVLDIFLFSGSFVPATLHLILFVQLVKSYQPLKQDRDHVYLLILSLLQVLAASSLTIDASFLILFGIYLLVCLATLMVFEMKRAAVRSGAQDLRRPQLLQTGDLAMSMIEKRQATRSLALISLGSLVVIAVLGAGLFFSIPRFGSGYFHRAARSSSLSGFSDNIRLGGIGTIQLDPAVVMRIRVKGDPVMLKRAKWRGVTLDHFDGRSWSKRARGAPVNYPAGRDFRVQDSTGLGSTVDYQVWLEPSATTYLFTTAQILQLRGQLTPLFRDPADDSFTARAHPSRRLSYDAVSRLPLPGEPEQQANLLPAERLSYLQLPALDPQMLDLARNAAGAGNNQEKASRVERYLQTNYSYSLDQGQLENPQPLAAFLMQTRRGHCEYFASSMVVLLRALKVPARIVNGFQAGEYNEIGENFVVRGRDAHSWVEVWIQGKGWLGFDPTPASAEPLSRSRLSIVLGNYLDAFELFWAEWVVGYDDVIQLSLFRDLQDKTAELSGMGQRRLYRGMVGLQQKLQAGVAWIVHTMRESPATVLISAAATLVLALLLVAAWQAQRKLWVKKSMRGNPAALAVRFYGDFLALAANYGNPKPPAATPSEFASTFRRSDLQRQVEELTKIYQVVRFCPRLPAQESEIRRARDLLREIRLHCRTHKGLH
jgi:transglutaminase-like putative cysteine protease